MKIPATSVAWKRRSLAIAPAHESHKPVREWTRRELQLLGTRPDRVLAKQLGIGRRSVAQKRMEQGLENFVAKKVRKRWTREIVKRLGKVPDCEIACELGIPAAIVTAWRFRHKIPGKRKTPTKPAHRWSELELEQLGKIPDAELARNLGISRGSVHYKREQLGIPLFE